MEKQLQQLIEGDHVVFTEIFRKHYGRTFMFLRRRVHCDEEAADLTQQCFLRLWQYHAALSKAYPLEQQLFVMARSLLLNHLEKRAVAEKAGKIYIRHEQAVISFEQEAETRNLVRTALNTLPAGEKNVLRLKYYNQYSNQEISNLLLISKKTVEARISSAYKRLRSILSIF